MPTASVASYAAFKTPFAGRLPTGDMSTFRRVVLNGLQAVVSSSDRVHLRSVTNQFHLRHLKARL
ncbi:MAG TPA: hypothetical protein VLH36_08765, partial [Steroidobacteraceae bacterium]|nr:hypothetical protein [Steroidobacteraceae bacterium]